MTIWYVAGMMKSFTGKNQIGGQVRKFRRRLGWSQEQLAKAMELHGIKSDQKSIDRLENETRKVYDHEFFWLARVLGVTQKNMFNPKFRKALAKIPELPNKRDGMSRWSGTFTKAGKKESIGHGKTIISRRFAGA